MSIFQASRPQSEGRPPSSQQVDPDPFGLIQNRKKTADLTSSSSSRSRPSSSAVSVASYLPQLGGAPTPLAERPFSKSQQSRHSSIASNSIPHLHDPLSISERSHHRSAHDISSSESERATTYPSDQVITSVSRPLSKVVSQPQTSLSAMDPSTSRIQLRSSQASVSDPRVSVASSRKPQQQQHQQRMHSNDYFCF